MTERGRQGAWTVARQVAWMAAVCLLGLRATATAAPGPVVVVYGKQSLPNEGERRFAQSLARHAVRWFRDGGLEVDLQDDSVLAGGLRGRRVAVLVYCAQPGAEQLRGLRQFTAGGGTLVVCYSLSAGLADLMGMKAGTYAKAPPDGRWSAMQFEKDRPPNTPERVQQSSPNLFTLEPVPGRSRVLAWWTDGAGRRTPEAACLQGPHGFWLTHVLLADGDAAAKGRLLLALAASRERGLWLDAARARLPLAQAAGTLRGPADARREASRLEDGPRAEAALAAVVSAEALLRDATRLLRDGRGAEAWLAAADLQRCMLDAYGSLQEPCAGEIRGVWDHSGQGLYPGDWPRTCRLLKQMGISDLFVNVAGPGFAHCRIEALPASPLLQTRGDSLKACVAAAHQEGLRVHAWLICFSTTQATPERLALYGRRGWLLLDTAGRPQAWLNPAEPAVRGLLVQAGTELVKRYAIDGLHLDFVRYPDFNGALGPDTRRRFEAARGGAVSGWPEAARRGPLFAEFTRWRSQQVTALVAEMRAMQRREAPGVWLTAAVYGKHPTCVESVGQAWESWLEQGYLDYALPMNYTENPTLFRDLVRVQTRTPRLARRVIGGIGVTAAESRLQAAQVIDQVRVLREGGAAGFALFDLDTTLEREILPVLRRGLTAPSDSRRRPLRLF